MKNEYIAIKKTKLLNKENVAIIKQENLYELQKLIIYQAQVTSNPVYWQTIEIIKRQ